MLTATVSPSFRSSASVPSATARAISLSIPSFSGAGTLSLQVYRPVLTFPSGAMKHQPILASFVPQAERGVGTPSAFFMTTWSASWLCPSSTASIPRVWEITSA